MDKRTVRTRQILGNALAELLGEMPLHRITIRQITDRAGVAYSTFFRNFETIEALLEIYVADFLNEIQALIMEIEIDNFREAARQSMRSHLKHVSNNPEKYRMVLTTPAIEHILEPFRKNMFANKLKTVKSLSPYFLADAPPIELLIRNQINNFVNLIEWWLLQETQPDIELVIDYHEQMAYFPMWRLLLGNEGAKQHLDIPLP